MVYVLKRLFPYRQYHRWLMAVGTAPPSGPCAFPEMEMVSSRRIRSMVASLSTNRVHLPTGASFCANPLRIFTPSRTMSHLRFKSSRANFEDRLSVQCVTPQAISSDEAYTKMLPLKTTRTMTYVTSTSTSVKKSVKSHQAKTLRKERDPKRLSSSSSPRNSLDHFQILKYPMVSESAVRNIIDKNTLVFVVEKTADKKSIRQAVKKIFKIQMKKVNTLVTPDGTKKAFLMLTPDRSALEIAKKIKAI